MFYIELASMNVFYSMWKLEHIIFHEGLSLIWNIFLTAMLLLLLKEVLKEVRVLRYLHNNSTMLIQKKFQKKSAIYYNC